MNQFVKKISLGAALAATTAAAFVATPASAQPWHGGYGRGDAGAAVVAGVAGLALGAALADQGPYYGAPEPVGYYAPYIGPAACYDAYPGYDDYCYPPDYYYRMGWSWRDGYWWNRAGQRFDHPFVGRGGPGGAPHAGFAGGMAGRGLAGGGFGGGHGGGFGGGGFAGGHGGSFGGGHGGGGGGRR
jgi:hypothetical protein